MLKERLNGRKTIFNRGIVYILGKKFLLLSKDKNHNAETTPFTGKSWMQFGIMKNCTTRVKSLPALTHFIQY